MQDQSTAWSTTPEVLQLSGAVMAANRGSARTTTPSMPRPPALAADNTWAFFDRLTECQKYDVHYYYAACKKCCPDGSERIAIVAAIVAAKSTSEEAVRAKRVEAASRGVIRGRKREMMRHVLYHCKHAIPREKEIASAILGGKAASKKEKAVQSPARATGGVGSNGGPRTASGTGGGPPGKRRRRNTVDGSIEQVTAFLSGGPKWRVTPFNSCQGGSQSVGGPQANARNIVQPQYTVNYAEGTVFLEVELPGVPQETVKLDVREGTLKISGERGVGSFGVGRQEKADAGEDRSAPGGKDGEVQLGSGKSGSGAVSAPEVEKLPDVLTHTITYMAELTLPSRADVGNASAEYTNGLLRVRVPPRKEPETLTIKIGM